MTQSLREVWLPADLCSRAEKKYGERFTSVEALLSHVLRSLVNEEAVQMDEEEARMIEERLRALGYLEPAS